METEPHKTQFVSSLTTPERIHAIVEAGVQPSLLAEALGVTPSGLRNWTAGLAEPNPISRERLDDIRHAMGMLVNIGLEPKRAAIWMKSRNPTPPFPRPLDLIIKEPETVFRIIETEFL